MTIFETNIAIIRHKHPKIADDLLQAPLGNTYETTRIAKTGEAIPILSSNQALHSLYNPEKEAERLCTTSSGFMLFCGFGCGIQIKVFLQKNPHAVCAITEVDYPSLKQLLSLIDYSAILADIRVILLPPCTEASFTTELIKTYLPTIHGTFGYHILRQWNEYFKTKTANLAYSIEKALEKIKTDFSIQAHFGKIWLRNIMFNLQLAGRITPEYPPIHNDRIAFVAGAGPSLEHNLEPLIKHRQRYCIFSTDTAFPALYTRGIIPDFFIAIDPQHISYLHIIESIPKKIIGIFDLCANTMVTRRFYDNGNPLFFTAGEHPLAQTARHFSPFPSLRTGSGTVAIAAYHAAQALGFRTIEYSGMDFAYTNGTAYTRGTYLSTLYDNSANRLLPQETAFVNLMFRTKTYSESTAHGFTYHTDLLDSYRDAFIAEKTHVTRWRREDFKQFPYQNFFSFFQKILKNNSSQPISAVLPFIAWCIGHGKKNFAAAELVSELISEYTKI